MHLLRKWNPFPEREDIQNRLSSLFGGAARVSAEFLGRITAKESGILFLPTHPHCYRPAKQFAKKHKKSIHETPSTSTTRTTWQSLRDSIGGPSESDGEQSRPVAVSLG